MINGLLLKAKLDARRAAVKGGLMVYAGILMTAALLFVAGAVALSLVPMLGPGLAMLCGAGFLVLIALALLLFAMAKNRRLARVSRAAAAASPGVAPGADYGTLLASGVTTGLLQKQLRDHPVRVMAAALAAGTVMGIMEARSKD